MEAEPFRQLAHPDLTVIRFGSRGDHNPSSELNIMVAVDRNIRKGKRDALENRAAGKSSRRSPGLDLCFLERWGDQFWNHHRERLDPSPPDGLAFGDPRQIGELPLPPAGAPAQAGGVPFYFLTGSCFTHKWHLDDCSEERPCSATGWTGPGTNRTDATPAESLQQA